MNQEISAAKHPLLLNKLGIDNFDNVEKIYDLQFTVEKALDHFKKDLRTDDDKKVMDTIKKNLIREVLNVLQRKKARKFA